MNKVKQNSTSYRKCGADLDSKTLSSEWNSIDWDKAYKVINRIESRIAKAYTKNNLNLVKKLQYLFVDNYYVKAMVVREISKGFEAGILGIDKCLWNKPDILMKSVHELNKKLYKCKKTKNVYLDKLNGEKVKVIVPTMHDRAMKLIFTKSLESIWNEKQDNINSVRNMIYRSFNRGKSKFFCYSINSYLNEKNYLWLLNNILIDKKVLSEFLSKGVLSENNVSAIYGVKSVFNCLEIQLLKCIFEALKKKLDETFIQDIFIYKNKMVIIWNKDNNIDISKEFIESLFSEINLNIHINEVQQGDIDNTYLEFFGWKYRKYNGKLNVNISKDCKLEIYEGIRKIIYTNRASSQDELIVKLNKKIKLAKRLYWGDKVNKVDFNSIDGVIYKQLWSWSIRRHGKQSKAKVKDKYWKNENCSYNFCTSEHKLIKFSKRNC